MTDQGQLVLAYDAGRLISLSSLAELTNLHPEIITRYVHYGLLDPMERRGSLLLFDVSAVARVRTIERLRRDLGVNLPGVGVILELLERIRRLERELERRRGL